MGKATEQKKDSSGVWMPDELCRNKKLKWLEKILLAKIYGLHKNGKCFASNMYFAKFLGITPWAVSMAIKKLKKEKLVKQISFNGRVRVLKARLCNMPKADFSKCQRQTLANAKGCLVKKPKANIVYKYNKKNRPLIARDFDLFWAVYPRKQGKDPARKKFKTHYDKLPPIKELVRIVKRHAASEQWQREGGRFIPHPTTWLNQGRWKDKLKVDPSQPVEEDPAEEGINISYQGNDAM